MSDRIDHGLAARLAARGYSLVRRHVAALCSGGVDSTVLVDVLARLSRGARPQRITVVHFDHGLHDGAAETAAAREIADRHGLACHVIRAADEQFAGDDNVQARARAWRYGEAAAFARANGCDTIVTGHSADDQVETMLLGAVTSSGLRSLAGMPLLRAIDDDQPTVALVRPLLTVSRADIVAHARAHDVHWVDDPSNASTDRYRRNRLRHEVIPRLLEVQPGAGAGLARSCEAIREASELIEALAVAVLAQVGDAQRLDVRRLARFEPPVRRAVIASWLRRARVGRGLSEQVVRAVDRLAVGGGRAGRCSAVNLASSNTCVRRDGYYLVHASR